ncbi:uncharacterized protein LOC122855594 [Aphidius gifuensis]|uniref:uncharacterized protein LOC122855594 n=1 Tax=Aphidius gifuensis TaxID=684658 RepID=UPI001CDD7300|nr:uncharacterized protein LOC122855594 [Aphidius gifuensis]
MKKNKLIFFVVYIFLNFLCQSLSSRSIRYPIDNNPSMNTFSGSFDENLEERHLFGGKKKKKLFKHHRRGHGCRPGHGCSGGYGWQPGNGGYYPQNQAGNEAFATSASAGVFGLFSIATATAVKPNYNHPNTHSSNFNFRPYY